MRPGIFSRGGCFGQDSAGFARAYQYRLPSERLSSRNCAAEWICPDHAARQHDGLRRRAHRAVGARQGNDDGESHRRDAVTIFMRKPALREAGILPKGGILRLYGRAKIHKSGPVYEEIWNRLIEAEKKNDPEKKGYGVLVTIERAEDLSGQPLT